MTAASALVIPEYQTSSGRSIPYPSRTILPTQESSHLIGGSSASITISMTSDADSLALFQNATASAPHAIPQHPSAVPSGTTQNKNMDLIVEQQQLKHDSDVIFSILDVDGSGSISNEDEFSNHLLGVGYSAPFVNELFEEMDANGDDVISSSEFRTLYMAVPSLRNLPGMMGQEEQDLTEESLAIEQDQSTIGDLLAAENDVFEATDEDGNESIDVAELESHLSRWRPEQRNDKSSPSPFHYTAVARIFGLLDGDGDQRISRQEFQDAFVRYSALRHALE